jgi:transketolase
MEFKERYPERFISVGISEANMISVAAGLSTVGVIPVVAAFAMFAVEKPFEQIRNSVAYPQLNVKIVATHSGISVGKDGVTHQAIEDIAITRAIPNLTVLVAADKIDTKSALKAALEHHGPVYLRLGRDDADVIYPDEKDFIIGRSDVLRDGEDLTIIACGIMVAGALKASDALEQEGIRAGVVNMHSIKPLDEKVIVDAAYRTGAIVTVEDHTRIGGLGSAVAELLVKERPIPMEQIALNDEFGESGVQDELFEKYGLSTAHIIAASKKVLARKSDE